MRRQSILMLGAILGLGIFGVVPQEAVAVVTLDDGGVHNIDYYIHDYVQVDYKSPGVRTTVNMLYRSAVFYPYSLAGYEDSVINISSIEMNKIYVYDNSQVTISGGSIPRGLIAYGGQVTVLGGWINTNVLALGNSQLTIYGGSIPDTLYANSSSKVTIYGGSIFGRMFVLQDAVVTLIGSDFVVDGQPFGYGELNNMSGAEYFYEPSRQLTGILASGDLLNSGFQIGGNAKIVLAPIPAPGALELENLISELQEIIDKADMALGTGDVDGAKASLREARDLLDDALLAD